MLKVVEGRWSLAFVSYPRYEASIFLHPDPAPDPSLARAPNLFLVPVLDRAPSLVLALSPDCSRACEASSGLPDHDCDLCKR